MVYFAVSEQHSFGEIKGPGCFKSKWTELARCTSFNVHELSYMTSLLQVEQVTATLFNTGTLRYARIEII